MLVAPPGGEPVLLDFFVEAPGPRRRPRARARRSSRSTSTSATPCRSSTSARRRAASTGAGGIARRARFGTCRSPSSPRRRRARARGRRGQRPAGLPVRDPRADPRLHAGGARALLPGGRAARGRRAARPRARRRARALGAEGAAPFYTGDIAARSSRLGARARRHADARGPRRLRGVPREPVRVALPRPRGAHQPAAVAGGILIAYALALLERAAGPPAARARRRDGGRAGRAHAGVPRGPRRARLPRALHGLAARLDHAHLGARRRRLGVRGDVHQRRGLGVVVPGTGIHLNNMMGEEDLSRSASSPHPPGRGCRR
jgi:gamma-glutamyltranspeptidase/glutathione hydrolase